MKIVNDITLKIIAVGLSVITIVFVINSPIEAMVFLNSPLTLGSMLLGILSLLFIMATIMSPIKGTDFIKLYIILLITLALSFKLFTMNEEELSNEDYKKVISKIEKNKLYKEVFKENKIDIPIRYKDINLNWDKKEKDKSKKEIYRKLKELKDQK